MPTERERKFDNEAFFAALEGARSARKLTWKEVAYQASVSPSTLTRIAQGKRPDVDSFAALVAWANLDSAAFIIGDSQAPPEPLSEISVLLRHDPNLSADATGMLEDIVKATYERLRNE